MNQLRLALATSLYLGLAPVAPGTFGTLGGVAIAWALSGTESFLLWNLLVAAGLYAVGRALGGWAEERANGHDPGWFVLDEVVGYLVAVAWIDGPTPLTLLTAFCAFRFFDIVKPWPVKRFERLPGGDGIMADDVVAGLWALLAVLLPLRLFVEAPWSV